MKKHLQPLTPAALATPAALPRPSPKGLGHCAIA